MATDSNRYSLLNQICRVCLSSRSDLLPVFDSIIPNIKSPPIAVIELWKIFSEVLVSNASIFPAQVCTECCSEIQKSYQLMLKCEKSDAILKLIPSHICDSSSRIHETIKQDTDEAEAVCAEFVGCEAHYSESDDDLEFNSSAPNNQSDEGNDSHSNQFAVEIKEENDTEDNIVQSEIGKQSRKCGKRKKNECNLVKRHIEKISEAKATHKCPRCPYTCIRAMNLQRHIFRRHVENIGSDEEQQYLENIKQENENVCIKSETENNDFVLGSLQSDAAETTKSESPDPTIQTDGTKSNSQTSHFVKYINRDGKVIKVWECGICSRNFQHQYTLMRHLPTHTNVRNFVCNECGKAFRQLSTLSQHRAIHSVERPYACETCNKSFNRISTLISHRKTHSDVKPFRCHMCHKGFHQKGNLRNHIYIHTNERPYRCTVCGKGFNQMSNLVCHTQKSHASEFGSIWTCHRCNMSFSKRTLLRAHELETHHIQAPNTKSHRSKLVSSRKNAAATVTTSSEETRLSSDSSSDYCKSEISGNGIVIPAIDTDAMKIARANKELPFAVLHFFEGPPHLVRIFDYDNQSLLRPAKNEDFIALKNQQTDQVEKVSVPIVAAVYQTLNVAGHPEFKVMPPKNIYKFINQQKNSLNCDSSDEANKGSNTTNDIPVGNIISLTPPQIPSDLRDVSANLETPLFESLNTVKDEPGSIDENTAIDFNNGSSTNVKSKAIAIAEDMNWWKRKSRNTDPYEENDGFSETFQNIATGNLLAPKKNCENDLMPDQNASILDISEAKNPFLSSSYSEATSDGQNQQLQKNSSFPPSMMLNNEHFLAGCNNATTMLNTITDFENSMSNILNVLRQEGVDHNILKSLFSDNPALLNDLNECLAEILP